ncbi:MAG: flagellar biosynthesis protein FlhB [Eubacteriales bacterium]
MAGNAQEKTEQATSRRLQEARKKGQVAKSTDLTGAVCLLAVVALLYATKDQFFLNIQRYFAGYFSHVGQFYAYNKEPASILNEAVIYSMKLLMPFVGMAFLAVVVTNLAQVGFIFSTETLKPKGTALNPMSGFSRIFSSRSVVELFKSLFKFLIIGYVTYSLISSNLKDLLLIFNRSPGGIYQDLLGFILRVAWWGALAYLILSLLDYAYQRHEYKKSLMMSKQEVKEEYRQFEGDPVVKSRQRELRRNISLNRVIGEVPRSTVIITNPTHLSVALLYQQGEMTAPRMVAKGAGWLAMKIREIARENGVPVIENKEVARFLYKNVEIDHEIPMEIYQAVAQILALVYRIRAKENYRNS